MLKEPFGRRATACLLVQTRSAAMACVNLSTHCNLSLQVTLRPLLPQSQRMVELTELEGLKQMFVVAK